MITDQERKSAEQVIKLHDGNSYDLLQEMSLPSHPEESESTVSKEEYLESCKEIRHQLGEVASINFIDCLQREDSQLSLWRVKYTLSEDEVFWAIGFDRETHKVKDVLVNW